MENILVSDIDLEVEYLAHHGVKGMKWGVRRYQPYSLIPRGSGKSGKESGKAARRKSARERKVRRLKKAITNKLRPKRNISVKELKSSSKSKKSRKEKQAEAKAEQIKTANTARQRRESAAKVVNSGSAKEVLANKDMLTTKQLNDAIQRINTEMTLKQINAMQNPSTMKKISKYVNKKNLDTAVGVVRSIGDMYKAVNDIRNAKNEAARAKAVKEAVRSGNAQTILNLQSKMTDSEVKDAMNRLRNLDSIRNTMKNETQAKPHTTIGETIQNKNKDKKAKDVVDDTNIPSFVPKKESTKAFDDYFENEVRKEKARKRKKDRNIKHSEILTSDLKKKDFLVHYNPNHDAKGRFASNPYGHVRLGMAQYNKTGDFSSDMGLPRERRYAQKVIRNTDAYNANPIADKFISPFKEAETLEEQFANQFKERELLKERRQVLDEIYDSPLDKIKSAVESNSPNPYPREPGYEGLVSEVNPNFGEPGTTNNCPFATLAMEVGSRGYDLIARKSEGGAGLGVFERWFPGASSTVFAPEKNASEEDKMNYNAYSEAKEKMLEYGDGASGNLSIMYDVNSGHSVHWRNDNGRVLVEDGQSGKTCNIDDVPNTYGVVPNFCLVNRLDNLEPDWKEISNDQALTVRDSNDTYWYDSFDTSIYDKDPSLRYY